MIVNEGSVQVVNADAPHLGGNCVFGDPRTFSPNVWNYVIDRFGVESVLDVGSGLGHSSRYFFRRGLQVIAVEGLADNVRDAIFPTLLHDLTNGPIQTRVDLVHCQEVVEHIEERFLENLLRSLTCGKYILMTNALPGQGGHHHVNEQSTEYWIEHLARYDCHVLASDTKRIRAMANAEGAPYFATTGLLLANRKRF
jgi:SAM-dependent methyltransferase